MLKMFESNLKVAFGPQPEFCDEFHLVDLRSLDNCLAVSKGVDWVFNLAADMVLHRFDCKYLHMLILQTGRDGFHSIQPFSHPVQQYNDFFQHG
jgi:hypothetical protein